MQNRGDFVQNKACYLMNIDDVDLCVYPKSIREGNRNQHQSPPWSSKEDFKKSLSVYLMTFSGLQAPCLLTGQ